ATFDVTVKEIKRKKLAELDDEFAKDISEFETLQELKNDIENKLKKRKEENAQNHLREQAIAKASENAQVDIPQAMIDTQIDDILQNFDLRLRSQGLSLEKFLQYSQQTQESIREQYQEDAKKAVKNQLVLEAIAKAEGIEVEEEDLEKEFERLAEMYNQKKEEIKEILTQQGQIDAIKHSIRIDKAVDFIIANAKIN
ncbi:MAG: trigger factor, partial [Clostridia bacterium]|nr:trigger factor [Clostridia bacterium]